MNAVYAADADLRIHGTTSGDFYGTSKDNVYQEVLASAKIK
jgi:hypothetical protein